jgi:CheY-like chemotaxis protein
MPMSLAPRVLVVEDEHDIAALIKHALERSGDARVEIVHSRVISSLKLE